MRILILSWRDIGHTYAGGAEVVTHQLAKHWVSWHHEVTVLSSRCPTSRSLESIDGVTYHRVGPYFSRRPFYFFYYLQLLYSFLHIYLFSYRHRVDVVIDQFHGPPFFTPLFVFKKRFGIIYEIARDIWWYQQPFPFSLLGYLLDPLIFIFYRNTPFLTLSSSTARDLVSMGIARQNIFVFRSGITFRPLYRLSEKESHPTIISVSRLVPMKRIEDSIRAFSLILKKFPNACLWIVGKGEPEYERTLRTLCEELGVVTSVRFWGYVSEHKKRDLLKRSWIFVSTSVKEGWGLSVIEANACGTLAVGYPVAGLKESIKSNVTGIITPRCTPSSLSRVLSRVLLNDLLRKRLSVNGLSYARTFQWDQSAARVLAFISSYFS